MGRMTGWSIAIGVADDAGDGRGAMLTERQQAAIRGAGNEFIVMVVVKPVAIWSEWSECEQKRFDFEGEWMTERYFRYFILDLPA